MEVLTMNTDKKLSTREIIENTEVSFVNPHAAYYVYYDKSNANLHGSLVIENNHFKDDMVSSYIKSIITKMQDFAKRKHIIPRGGELKFTTNGNAISIELVSDVINPGHELEETIEADKKKKVSINKEDSKSDTKSNAHLKFKYTESTSTLMNGPTKPDYEFPVDRIYIYRNIYTDKFTMSIQLDEVKPNKLTFEVLHDMCPIKMHKYMLENRSADYNPNSKYPFDNMTTGHLTINLESGYLGHQTSSELYKDNVIEAVVRINDPKIYNKFIKYVFMINSGLITDFSKGAFDIFLKDLKDDLKNNQFCADASKKVWYAGGAGTETKGNSEYYGGAGSKV